MAASTHIAYQKTHVQYLRKQLLALSKKIQLEDSVICLIENDDQFRLDELLLILDQFQSRNKAVKPSELFPDVQIPKRTGIILNPLGFYLGKIKTENWSEIGIIFSKTMIESKVNSQGIYQCMKVLNVLSKEEHINGNSSALASMLARSTVQASKASFGCRTPISALDLWFMAEVFRIFAPSSGLSFDKIIHDLLSLARNKPETIGVRGLMQRRSQWLKSHSRRNY